ncbi:MAG: FKBP-type peptidyl-prolyl cis-trans isomerase [Bacteroidota bacterium]
MKQLTGLVLIILAAGLFSCDNLKQESVKLETELDSVSYAFGVYFGNQLKMGENIDSINAEAIAAAVNDVYGGADLKVQEEEIGNVIRAYLTRAAETAGASQMEKSASFLEDNKTKEGVKVTESGLQYEVLQEGNGATPDANDMVTVHYRGTLTDGTVFDSSYDRGEPATFATNRVIPGWQEALQMMQVGSKWVVYIPPQLGYGTNPPPNSEIKPNDVLIFEMELLEVQPQE